MSEITNTGSEAESQAPNENNETQITFTCNHCEQDTPEEEKQTFGDADYCEECREKIHTCTRCSTIDHQDNMQYVESQEGQVCDTCISDHFFTCAECQTTQSDNGRRNVYGSRGRNTDICQPCYENSGNYDYCEDCDNNYHTDQTTYNEERGCSLCLSCDEEEREREPSEPHADLIRDYGYKPSLVFFRDEEQDNSVKEGLGLEIEIEKSESQTGLKEATETIKNDFWYFKHDGSLNNGMEIVTHPLTFNWLEKNRPTIEKHLNYLQKQGYKSYNTTTCGIHIHISRTRLSDTWHLFRFMKFFAENKQFILRISQRVEEHLNRWAKLDTNDRQELMRKAKTKFLSEERYQAINLNNKATIEIRIFRGTLKTESLYKNIQFVESLINFTKENTTSKITLENFGAYIQENKAKYIDLFNYIARKELITGVQQ